MTIQQKCKKLLTFFIGWRNSADVRINGLIRDCEGQIAADFCDT
jgi:hypothetical protein